MTDYTRQIEQIKTAQSLDEIHAVARSFSAQATGEGGILYTGKVGSVDAMVIAKELAHKTGLSIINDTQRAQFLSNEHVEKAIRKSAERILADQGVPLDQVEKIGPDFLYGNGKAAPKSPTSIKNSLWGEASAEFAGSLRGPVVVVGSAANAERVLAQAEVPAVLRANQVSTLGDHSLASLRELHTHAGIQAVLPKVQASFIDASSKGIFIDPSMAGKQVTQVAISREVAMTMHLDGSRFVGAAALSEAGFVPASLVSTAPAEVLGAATSRIQEPVVTSGGLSRGLSPGAVRGVGIVAAAGFVYDATTTASHAYDLLDQGNRTGAQSALEHFAGRSAGGAAFAVAGAEIGSFGGPFGAFVGGAIGGGIGVFGGDKLADAYDNHRIYNQTDAKGMTWNYDPAQPQQGWTCDLPPLPATPHGQHFTADPVLTERLTFQANNTAVELALSHPAPPRDPYTQPAGANDPPSKLAAPWIRDVDTRQWSRQVTDQVMEHGLTVNHSDPATPQRTAQLDAAAQQTIATNLAQSPHGMAEHYQSLYEQQGWQKHGPMPEAVSNALKTPAHTLEASDGHTYTQTQNGQWQTPGTLWGTNVAEGHVRSELDATDRMAAPAAKAAPSLASNDPRHPDNPHHGLYARLKERIPEASGDRLLQFTDACNTKGIGDKNLGEITLDEQGGHIIFYRSLAGPAAIVDLKEPPPQPEQSIQHVQQTDQVREQIQAQIQAQNAQLSQHQGPTLGGQGF